MNTPKVAVQTRQEVEKFVVRLPKGMRSRIAEVSRLSHRSMNSEIIARLEESLGSSTSSAEGDVAAPSAPLLRSVDGTIQDQERQLLMRFRGLNAEKRAALLELLTQ